MAPKRATSARSRSAARPSALARAIDHLRAEPSRTWSLVITFYGDAIVPRGGEVWLGTVLQFFAHLGIESGVVRTAMSRLAADGWLERRKVGRESFYGLPARGRATFLDAAAHIYHPQPPAWPGHFDLILTGGGHRRPELRAAMEGAGFASLAPEAWIAPGGRATPPIASSALRFELRGDATTTRALAARAWPLHRMAAAYERFTAAFGPLRTSLAGGRQLSDLDALAARVLLVHAFRRVVLHDPLLPPAALPDAWPGVEARRLCADVYRRVLPASERWLDANGRVAPEMPLPAARGLSDRFPG